VSETPYLDKIGLARASGAARRAGSGDMDRDVPRLLGLDERYEAGGGLSPGDMRRRSRLRESVEHGTGGMTRDYERVEHGRVQQVGGYMKHLQGQLAAWRSGPGKIAPDAWGLVGGEARKDLTMGPHNSNHRVAVQHHMRNAVQAIDKGDTPSAVGHLFTGAMEARDRGLEGPHQELLAHANGLRHDMGMGNIS